ncbi:UBA domain-containing protein Mud1-like [Penaeus japonicus]|uniref:UBA domain-containing protein Mud1-like n=1 Tax=Penaeus japonicus TaxID=27405 RepID=UPI001C7108AE|nr:UBA domain-containing protein Mud1-like [Penaeus japonicus]
MPLTVDTGAEKTLKLCGVTGHCVQLKGPVEARIGVGSAVQRLPVYVADLDEPCLLGLDYLTQSKACVDLGRKLVRMHGEDVSLLPEQSDRVLLEPGSYSWGHSEKEDDVSSSSGDEDVTDADRDEDEHLGGEDDATDVNGDPEPGLGDGDAPLGATANLPPPTPPLQLILTGKKTTQPYCKYLLRLKYSTI